jgi:hypothetical protein
MGFHPAAKNNSKGTGSSKLGVEGWLSGRKRWS